MNFLKSLDFAPLLLESFQPWVHTWHIAHLPSPLWQRSCPSASALRWCSCNCLAAARMLCPFPLPPRFDLRVAFLFPWPAFPHQGEEEGPKAPAACRRSLITHQCPKEWWQRKTNTDSSLYIKHWSDIISHCVVVLLFPISTASWCGGGMGEREREKKHPYGPPFQELLTPEKKKNAIFSSVS